MMPSKLHDAGTANQSVNAGEAAAARAADNYPVVFVHGFLDEGGLWQSVAGVLADQGVTSVAPDLPGMGGRASEPGPFTLNRLATEVASVVNGFDRPVVLVGHSMGAQVAELVAAAHPERVAALVLLTPVPLGGLPVPAEVAAAMRALGGNADAQRALRRQFAGRHVESVLDNLVDVGMKVQVSAVQAFFDAWSGGDASGQSASRYHGPVLIAVGADDTFIAPDLVEAYVAPRFPQASTVSIPEVGHWPHAEQPVAVARILADFLTRATQAQAL